MLPKDFAKRCATRDEWKIKINEIYKEASYMAVGFVLLLSLLVIFVK